MFVKHPDLPGLLAVVSAIGFVMMVTLGFIVP